MHLALAIPEEYLLKFHNVVDAKSLWAAIKARFGESLEYYEVSTDSGDFGGLYAGGKKSRERSYGDNWARAMLQTNESSSQATGGSRLGLVECFDVRSSDEENIPANDRSSKVDGFHVVPPPITRNFLTPRADISFAGLDEYAIRKKIIESKH
ncbi:hypothetical protein Tco_0740860 [Tanacetum coccineum]